MQSLCITTYDVRSIPALGRCARYNIYFSRVCAARSLVFFLVLHWIVYSWFSLRFSLTLKYYVFYYICCVRCYDAQYDLQVGIIIASLFVLLIFCSGRLSYFLFIVFIWVSIYNVQVLPTVYYWKSVSSRSTIIIRRVGGYQRKQRGNDYSHL
jgi:small-conductance mechanosensitive channel